ncbi:MAG: hypothetical protein ABI634_09765 [Acidobacteriota bacterium]
MRTHPILALILACLVARVAPAAAQQTQNFPLTDPQGLTASGVTVDTAEFLNRKAVRLVHAQAGETIVMLPGTADFQDGTIEADVAVKITTPPGVRMPGFLGIAFRARPDASSFDLFYLRPGNSTAVDQAMRNHAVQYSAAPGHGWYELRRNWPWVYESHADLKLDAWTHVKIEVAGRTARLYLNNATQPTLIVDGLKGLDLRGSVGLYGFSGEEAYFSNVRVTRAPPLPVTNGSDAAGTWAVKLATDAGVYDGALQLRREGRRVSGTWSGALGENRPVIGTWRDGYIELSFPGAWPKEAGGTPGPVVTRLAGWIDGTTGNGRGTIEMRADGLWTATRKP